MRLAKYVRLKPGGNAELRSQVRATSILGIVAIKLLNGALAVAVAQEMAPLSALGIAPITNIDRLVDFGCRDAMNITKIEKPNKQITDKEGLFRSYDYQGMTLTTVEQQVEGVWASKMLAGFLPRWGILDSKALSLSDGIRSKIRKAFGREKPRCPVWIGYRWNS
jgi:hypothetical protein